MNGFGELAKMVRTDYEHRAGRGELESSAIPEKIEPIKKALEFMEVGGYLATHGKHKIPMSEIEEGTRRLQSALAKVLSAEKRSISVDGILSVQTLARLFSVPKCMNKRAYTTKARVSPRAFVGSTVRYWIESIPSVVGTKGENLLHDGIRLWSQFINVEVRRAKSKDDANVLILSENLDDGIYRVVGDADIGPPNGKPLTIQLNAAEAPWNRDLFSATVAHEFGHILGSRHIENGMMSPFITGVQSPTAKDIEALLAVGWQRV